MHSVRVGNKRLSRLGLGSWAFGGPYKHGYGEQNDNDSLATIQRAIESGITWIDTAPIYGFGHAEEIVGRALKNHPGISIAGKMGLYPIVDQSKPKIEWEIQRDLSPERIEQELNESLLRLDRSFLDYYMIHWPDPKRSAEEAWSKLSILKARGLIKNIGLSNFYLQDLQFLNSYLPLDFVQIPYSIVHRDYEHEVIPWLKEKRLPTMIYSPLHGGVLSGRDSIGKRGKGDWRKGHKYYSKSFQNLYRFLSAKLNNIAENHRSNPAAISIRWILQKCPTATVILGARTPKQLDELLKIPKEDLTEQEMNSIEDIVQEHHPNAKKLFPEKF